MYGYEPWYEHYKFDDKSSPPTNPSTFEGIVLGWLTYGGFQSHGGNPPSRHDFGNPHMKIHNLHVSGQIIIIH